MKGSVKSFFYSIAACWILIFCACSRPPSEVDLARLKLLENRYASFEFELKYELYLIARLRNDIHVSDEDIIDVYKTFFFDETGNRRRTTTFVYLNFYDFKDKFQYQLALDPSTSTFIKNRSDYY